MMDKQLTAMQELFETYWHFIPNVLMVKEEMIAKEKEQIKAACTHGNRQEVYDATETLAEQYYSRTYKND